MIDPRALQQHFKKIYQKQQPPRQDVPRVPDPAPLTAIQAIPLPIEESIKQPEIIPEQPKEEINLLIDVPPSIDQIIINDFEEESQEPGTNSLDEYDPYGYYSGPRF